MLPPRSILFATPGRADPHCRGVDGEGEAMALVSFRRRVSCHHWHEVVVIRIGHAARVGTIWFHKMSNSVTLA